MFSAPISFGIGGSTAFMLVLCCGLACLPRRAMRNPITRSNKQKKQHMKPENMFINLFLLWESRLLVGRESRLLLIHVLAMFVVCCLSTTLQSQENEEPANIKIRVLWQLEIEPEGPFVHLVDFLDDQLRGMNICSANQPHYKYC